MHEKRQKERAERPSTNFLEDTGLPYDEAMFEDEYTEEHYFLDKMDPTIAEVFTTKRSPD